MKIFSQRIAILTIALLVNASCTKNDNPLPVVSPPRMTEISISGEGLIYNITVFFNEGVYANSDKTGDLTPNDISVLLVSQNNFVSSYIITHSACQRNANIRLVLNKEPTYDEIITVQPTTSNSIYNFNGFAMNISKKLSIAINGT